MFWQLASAANRALPAETAHRLAVSAMKFGFVPAAMQADAQMQIGCAGLDFANPLGLAAIAVPNAITSAGVPYGVTFLAPAGRERLLADLACAFTAAAAVP